MSTTLIVFASKECVRKGCSGTICDFKETPFNEFVDICVFDDSFFCFYKAECVYSTKKDSCEWKNEAVITQCVMEYKRKDQCVC